MLTTERLWSAYARVQASQVKGADSKRQLTDLVSLVRFALGLDGELKPFADEVDKRFQAWIFRHNAQRGTAFTPEQTEWLRLMKDHIASSCSISREFATHGRQGWPEGLKELDLMMTPRMGACSWPTRAACRKAVRPGAVWQGAGWALMGVRLNVTVVDVWWSEELVA
jgi:hypothetical protein